MHPASNVRFVAVDPRLPDRRSRADPTTNRKSCFGSVRCHFMTPKKKCVAYRRRKRRITDGKKGVDRPCGQFRIVSSMPKNQWRRREMGRLNGARNGSATRHSGARPGSGQDRRKPLPQSAGQTESVDPLPAPSPSTGAVSCGSWAALPAGRKASRLNSAIFAPRNVRSRNSDRRPWRIGQGQCPACTRRQSPARYARAAPAGACDGQGRIVAQPSR